MQWVNLKKQLIYIIRFIINYSIFLVLRYTTVSDCEYKEDVLKLLNSLVNILAIIKHFQIKIKEWLASQNLSTPTEDQILDVVRKNYDLTLKLQDSLDHYERYSEKPKHASFFISMVRDVLVDTRKSVYYSIKEGHAIPNEYLTQTSSNVITPTTPIAPPGPIN